MRCPDCNKFVSYDDVFEPEVNDLTLDDKQLTGEVRVVLPCAECGTELKDCTFEPEADWTDVLEEHKCKEQQDDEDPEFEAESNSIELTIRTEGSGRYMKTFYGYSMEVEVTCRACGKVVHTETLTDDQQASSFEECC